MSMHGRKTNCTVACWHSIKIGCALQWSIDERWVCQHQNRSNGRKTKAREKRVERDYQNTCRQCRSTGLHSTVQSWFMSFIHPVDRHGLQCKSAKGFVSTRLACCGIVTWIGNQHHSFGELSSQNINIWFKRRKIQWKCRGQLCSGARKAHNCRKFHQDVR